MALIDYLEGNLEIAVRLLELILEAIAIFCVFLGIFNTAKLVLTFRRERNRRFLLPFVQLRLKLGLWLGLALEFQLGADIVKTTVAPTLETLAKLGLVAVIRTFLNYFLNKELAEELALKQAVSEGKVDEV